MPSSSSSGRPDEWIVRMPDRVSVVSRLGGRSRARNLAGIPGWIQPRETRPARVLQAAFLVSRVVRVARIISRNPGPKTRGGVPKRDSKAVLTMGTLPDFKPSFKRD
jgi:hypothetical protein